MKRTLAILLAAASVQSALAGWQPGLREIAFASGGAINKTSYDAATTNITLALSRALSTGSRTTYTTYVYWGQIYLDGRTYNFAESFNQAVFLKIDGAIILDNANYKATTTGAITRAPGWYDFELRLYCYNSNAGPVSQDSWGTTARGFGWNTSGYTQKAGSYYPCPSDPGDGTLFRCDDGAGTDDVLDIASDPAVSAPGAAAETRQGLAAGDGLALSVPAVWVNETRTMAATCTGWTLYNAAGDVEDSGAGNSVNYVHPTPAAYRKLVWHWTLSDPTGDANRRYVRYLDGSDANNGQSWDAAFASIQAAIAACPVGGSVVVGPGTYLAANTAVTADSVVHAIYIDKDITVLAAEGPEKTIVDAGTDRERAAARVAAANALLAGFTFKNGSNNSTKNKPCGVEATAGTVSNCVASVRGQWNRQGAVFRLWGTALGRDLRVAPATWTSHQQSSVVYVSDTATLNGLVFTNFICNADINTESTGQGGDIGYFLNIDSSGVVSNALIAKCTMRGSGDVELLSLKPMIVLNGNGVKFSDSTIAGNTIRSPFGMIQVSNAKVVATNLVIWGNSTLATAHPDINGGSNAARFFHSCYSEAPANSASGSIAVDPLFVDAARGDYHLKPLSQAAEMGATWLRPAAVAPAPFECAADADAYVSAAGEPLAATFTGYATEGHTIVSAVWNFGDGATGTDWPTASHTYSAPGAYTVTVTVTDSNGDTATFTVARNLVAVPATCYVREGSSGTYPYDSWEKATDDICAAVAVGSAGVVVTNGTYEIGDPHIQLLKPVSITSVEGPSATTLISTGGTSRNHRLFTVGPSSGAFIAGFTLVDGYSTVYYWNTAVEMQSGTLSNCVVRGTRNISRSSANYFCGTAKAVDCVFDGAGMALGNASLANMSGVRIEGDAVLDRCEIRGYRVDTERDDGSRDGEAPVRIASANAVLRNSLVHHCTNGVSQAAKHHGVIALLSGRIENCTIVDNKSGGYGGGVWAKGGTIANSIVHGNTALISGADLYSTVATAVATNTLASDFTSWVRPVGSDCVAKSPNFDAENPYHLTTLSTACIDKGLALDWLDGALDLDRQPRVAGEAVDLGCYEFAGSTDVPLGGTLDLAATQGRVPFALAAEVSVVGDETGLVVTWNFGDGTVTTGSTSETHTYATPGAYQVTVTVRNGGGEEVVIAAPQAVVAVPETCYVAKGAASVSPYDTWEKAATNIEDAVALAPRGVLVSNGTYMVGSLGVILSADTELRSVNGPDETVIDSAGLGRCVWIAHAGAVCDGFRLVRGAGYYGERGTFACVEGGLLSNCILTNCVSVYRDAAVYVRANGRMRDCVVDLTGMGGNAGHSMFWDVNVSGGGVVERCVIRNYKFTDATAGGGGGFSHSAVTVADGGTVRNCLVQDSELTATVEGGAILSAVRVTGSGTFENCTVVNSTAKQAGSGLRITAAANATPVVRNNIVWGSTATDGSLNADVYDGAVPAAPRITYSCAANLAAGEGNTTADPRFVGAGRRKPPYSLSSRSPLLNAGTYLDWMDGATDLVGLPRVAGTAPAMGCYESPYAGATVMEVR